MEKRIFVAIGVSIAFLWLWAIVAPRLFPELAKPAVKPTSAATSTSAPRTSASAGSPSGARIVPPSPAAIVAPRTEIEPVAAVSADAIRETVIETPDYVARFSNRGAQLVSFQLRNYRTHANGPVDLVKRRAASRTDYPFAIESASADVSRRLNSALYEVSELEDRGVRTLQYKFSSPDGLRATKTFRLGRNQYLFDFTIEVKAPSPYRVVIGPGIRNLEKRELANAALITGNGVVQREGKLKLLSREKGDRLSIFEESEFVGIEDNYFLTGLRPSKAGASTIRRVKFRGDGKSVREEIYAGLNATGEGSVTGSAFFGPKETHLLDNYGLGKMLQYGMFGAIARVLLAMLTWINQFTRNFGFAIIVLTIFIKVVLYPLQHKSIVSMKKMQKVQPKMEAIKSKYKKAKTDPEQRQKMNVEMMKLYQVEGINPMSGCLPILLQLPILWGFYNLLSRAIELRGAPFILWIHDLSEMDPYYITPVLMTITMFIQTWMMPSTGDPAQRKIFLVMPIFFGYFFKEMPSGLVLYWLVQNVLTILQQWIMNKWWKEHPAELAKE
ncbi:MAG: membrane protein insertase YidC [Thermoanaerobaculia bacterium]|nr:membrane protein insertase YidC [Thermoanaerobaculia bacterium]